MNNGLGDHLHDELATKASSLRQALNLSPSDVNVDGASIEFPDGSLNISYSAESKKSGQLK